MKLTALSSEWIAQQEAERPAAGGGHRAVLRQRWENLLFLHWKFEPRVVQRALPPGLELLTFDGSAWVGLVPIFMRNVRPRFVPPIPGLSNFLELNLRTYVHDGAGHTGVYFFALTCDQPLVVEAANRLLHLNYRHAFMAAEASSGRTISFRSQRIGQPGADRFVYTPLPDDRLICDAGTLEYFLMERYRILLSVDGKLRSVQVRHAPHRLHGVRLDEWGENEFSLAGLPRPCRAPDHLCVGETVDLEVFRPETLRVNR